ncbi:MAG TPA: sigma-70 family RNA polymerase sigma factor [Dermatophilaceae bacterium]|nr:sigma-70 family RNA polymerase sigma factor [Dermatophilaceae bacterium]
MTGIAPLGRSQTLMRERDDAVAALFQLHVANLVRLGMCLLGDRGAAEEVVQDSFESLHRNWWRLRDHGACLAYLRAGVVNGCRSRQRKLLRGRARMPVIGVTSSGTAPSSEETVVAAMEAADVAAAVRLLPPRQREVLVCRYYLELSEAQTAALLDIGRGSVKRHTFRALAALSRRLGVQA